MSLHARSGAVKAALDNRGYPYIAKLGDTPHTFEFGRCPWCNSAAGSLLSLFADGSTDFRCGKCDCTSASDVLSVFEIDLDRPARKIITPMDYADFRERHADDRPVYIEQLLRRAEIMNVNGGSKGKKTRFVTQMILTFVMGRLFLDLFQCHRQPGKVLVADYELHGDSIRKRVDAMIAAMKLPPDVGRRIQFHSMRGTDYLNLFELCDWLERIPPGTYSLVVIDALYRATPEGHDENSNAGVTKLYNRLDQAAIKHGCSFVIVHHFSKGNQSDKAVADLGSGAGAQSRAADCHLALREHAAPNHVVLCGVVRDFAPLEDVVLRYDHPLWVHAPGVDPADTSKYAKCDWSDVAALLTKKPARRTDFVEITAARLNVSQKMVGQLLNFAINEGHITQEGGKGADVLLFDAKLAPTASLDFTEIIGRHCIERPFDDPVFVSGGLTRGRRARHVTVGGLEIEERIRLAFAVSAPSAMNGEQPFPNDLAPTILDAAFQKP